MNLEKIEKARADAADSLEVMLEKCYVYARMDLDKFPDEYREIYTTITRAIEELDCAENVRAVMRLRYNYGHKFIDVSRLLGITYQWVYELHKNGVCLLEKHLSVCLTNGKNCDIL